MQNRIGIFFDTGEALTRQDIMESLPENTSILGSRQDERRMCTVYKIRHDDLDLHEFGTTSVEYKITNKKWVKCK